MEEIKNQVTGFFEEAPGEKSSNRLIFIIGMFWLMAVTTLVIALKCFYKLEVTWTEIWMFFTTIAGVLGGSKVAQKFAESKNS